MLTTLPGSILDAEWVFEVTIGSTVTPKDFGIVAVLDGSEYTRARSCKILTLCSGILKLTPLKLAAVPPPTALCEISLDSNAIDVAFSESGTRIAVLTAFGFS